MLLLGTAAGLFAQAGRAELFGTVRDPAGLAVPGASVQLQDENTGVVRNATTSSAGNYYFGALAPGTYDVTVRQEKFQTLHRTGIRLHVADRITLDLPLELGPTSQTVQVSAAAPMLQTGTGTVSFGLNENTTSALPLDGRNFVPLIALSPGVMLPPGQVLPRINGSRPRTSEYLYDGVSVLQPEPGQVAYYPIIDAIEEFRVQTNAYSAEYGRSNGGVIQVNSKSGTNDFHGTVFEFLRNEALNARNLFASRGAKPPFRRNQYGFVLGGPVQKNKTFFFADWQGTRLLTGVTRFSTVPTTAQRNGIFTSSIIDPSSGSARTPFTNNLVPVNRMDPAALKLLARYPSPNVFTATGAEAAGNNYSRTGSDIDNANQFDGRVDRYFGQHHRLFVHYSYLNDHSVPMSPLPDGSGALTSAVIGDTTTRGDSVVAEHTWMPSATSVNQLRFGFTRRGFERSELQTGESTQQLTGIPGIPATSFSDVLPVFSIAGYQQLGPSGSANARFTTSVTEVLDEFTHVHGAHSLKYGADLRWERLDVLQPPNPTGNFQFTSVLTGNAFASFLLGQVQSFSIDAQKDVLKPRAHIAEFFVQDDWKASSRLTLNLGVRYTLNFPSTEANNHAAVFNLATQKLDYLGQNGVPRSARDLEKHNFGPRVGLAYRVSDSFVIRSGYGLTWIEQAGITTPFTTPLFPFIQTLTQSSLDNVTPAFVLSQGPSVQVTPPNPDSGLGQGVFGVQRDNGSGYAQQWNFTLQKTFGSNWSAEIGYLGSKLTRLGVPDTNMNQLPASDLALGSQLTQLVPNPYYGIVPASSSLGAAMIARQQLMRPFPEFTAVTLYRNNVGHSTYHSFQAHVTRRMSRGLTLTAAYTFGKLIDDAGAVFDSAVLTGPVLNFQAADSFNRHLEKDESTGSIPQVFSSGFVYELPFRGRFIGGWELAGDIRGQSGMPLAVTQATNFNAAFGFGTQRPNLIANPNLPNDERTTGHYFNTAAFTTAPVFTIGNSSRNPVRGPGFEGADLMLGKTFAVTERVHLEFRAEAFNVSNTPPLGQPNGSFGSAAFGTITTAGDPRDFEMVLKVKF
ncbi:MAG TPA: TonB-dependent receptor [Bryobacteraceae bacterium]|nr:TonB-dependent receptor [Bryobacteraceae bacterium]